MLINLTAAAGASCCSASRERASEREFAQAAESRAAPTLLAGPLQGGSIKIRLNCNAGLAEPCHVAGKAFQGQASERSFNPRREHSRPQVGYAVKR